MWRGVGGGVTAVGLENSFLFIYYSFIIIIIIIGASSVAQLVKNPSANARDTRDKGSIPGWGRSPGEGNGNSLQYSCLENSMDRGGWQATAHGVADSDVTERACVSTHTHTHTLSLSHTHTRTHTHSDNYYFGCSGSPL